ncbi:MAG: bifunctional NADP-dependent methylenetetrahydromethanopterin dehydrogenase/methylenetetrahydrofolate dehydrogenase [Planctomycetaceae bacterium]|nr:bifunctional NADP-dependent methylenetetrahydromethanopterin dehydrogenase/methylenetetrahydrofolate dehydrogenase [Planctomycetaceae bacterium]MCA9044776.1 bifunctional NADP-dependent methylenetetrahydromethanopterin dehydrogenase/methylenetetrahydrofolate dehydrogenase [Planctomycetaceae bacterium]
MKRILVQLDSDPHPSVFDQVVAYDSGAEQILSYGAVTAQNCTPLVHGAMFTRGPGDLKSTAIFIGGSKAADGEAILNQVKETLFSPLTVSVMLDSNGCNTTASAAVHCAARHVALKGVEAVVLGGTGPVGQRAAQILAAEGAKVRLASRQLPKAEAACSQIRQLVPGATISAAESGDDGLAATLDGAELIIAAGAAGVQFLTAEEWTAIDSLKVIIDLNAVPPLGLGGVELTDKATEREGVICYGALGVGGLKMKIHRKAVEQLFESNSQILDTFEIHKLGATLA